MNPVEFPPGCTNLAAKTAKTVNWRENNLMRWDNGTTLLPVGGWEKYNYPPFTDKVRKMHRWSDNLNNSYTAYLCESHVYVDIAGVLTDITPADGMNIPTGNNGAYGDATYNLSTYGTKRPGESRLRMFTPCYSMDNWGEELRVMTSADGRLLKWSPTAAAGTKLTAVANAPISNRAFVVTPERHIMLFGMGGQFDKFGWCDEEDDTNWAFTDVTSRAGFYELQPKSAIFTQQLFEDGILLFTSAMCYKIDYVGLPYVYAYKPIGRVPAPLSPASVVSIPIGVGWPSVDGWWLYDGTTPRAVHCDVWDFITKTCDVPNSRFMASMVHQQSKGEIWWFYVSYGMGTDDNSRYIFYDYRSQIWGMGKLNRTCGFVFANDRFPIMSDGVNIYRHETGFSYPGAIEMPWIESMDLTANGGENWTTLNKLLPDISGDRTAVRFSVVKFNDRTDYSKESRSPLKSVNEYGWVDIRETARDMRLRIDMVKEQAWGTVGPLLLDTHVRGKKA